MRAVSANGNTVDSLRVAVLAALNIADELMRLQEHCRLLRGTMSETQTILRTRANSLSGLLDSVLDDEPPLPRIAFPSPPAGSITHRIVTCQPASLTLASIQRPACKAGAAVNAG